MSLQTDGGSSPFIKMRQVYWEAKQTFNHSMGQQDDSCIVSSDSELDIKLELLQAADSSFNSLMSVLLAYRNRLQNFINTQNELGLALFRYGKKDSTAAGKIMCVSGSSLFKAAHHHSMLQTSLLDMFQEVQTFQFKATADALQTVEKMEKARKSYRSGLMWMKDESTDLDPDVNKKLKKFRRVQEHIKNMKIRFDSLKLETMQKIDLFLLSRSNLFSYSLVPYIKTFKKVSRYSVTLMVFALDSIPRNLSYNFVTLKELNKYSKILLPNFEKLNSSDELSKIQSKNKKSVKKSKKYSLAADESIKADSLTDFTVSSPLLLNDCRRSIATTLSNKNEDSLIDLKEQSERVCHPLKSTVKDCSQKPRYSEDLRGLNLNTRTDYGYQFSTCNLEKEFESLSDLFKPVSQQPNIQNTDDLHFWSLMQNFGTSERSGKSSEGKEHQLKDTSLVPNKVSSYRNESESKWNDILIQFDPFSNESSKLNKSEVDGLC